MKPGPEPARWQSVQPVAISLKSERCLRTHNRFSTCQACIETCPAGAMQVTPAITLNREACTGCGACLSACPAGAFEGEDGAATLLEAAAPLRGKHVVELACPRHSHPERAPVAVDAVLRADACLAALGPAAYLSLLGLGIGTIVARLDACVSCPLGKAQANIEKSLATAAEILASWQQQDRVVGRSTAASSEWQARPLVVTSGGACLAARFSARCHGQAGRYGCAFAADPDGRR